MGVSNETPYGVMKFCQASQQVLPSVHLSIYLPCVCVCIYCLEWHAPTSLCFLSLSFSRTHKHTHTHTNSHTHFLPTYQPIFCPSDCIMYIYIHKYRFYMTLRLYHMLYRLYHHLIYIDIILYYRFCIKVISYGSYHHSFCEHYT